MDLWTRPNEIDPNPAGWFFLDVHYNGIIYKCLGNVGYTGKARHVDLPAEIEKIDLDCIGVAEKEARWKAYHETKDAVKRIALAKLNDYGK